MRKYFEYRFIRGSVNFDYEQVSGIPLRAEDEIKLNELGLEGWEVVDFFEGTGRPEGASGSKRMIYLMKKEFNRPIDYERSIQERTREIEEARESIEKEGL